MTRPGTRLRFGQKAIVPVRQYNRTSKTYSEGVLGIIVQPIRRAPATTIRGDFDADSRALLKTRTAYYADVVITNESGNALSLYAPRFNPVFRDGGPSDVILMGFGGDLPNCPETLQPESFDHRGDRWVTCVVNVSTPSRPITGLQYMDPPYGSEGHYPGDPSPDFNKYYDLGTIIWS